MPASIKTTINSQNDYIMFFVVLVAKKSTRDDTQAMNYDVPTIFFRGKAGVGKSTLISSLTGKEIASLVISEQGSTADASQSDGISFKEVSEMSSQSFAEQ